MVKKEEEENSGTGYKGRQYPIILYNRVVLLHKTTKLLIFVCSFNLNNKLNDSIIGSLVRSHLFLMISIVRVNRICKFLVKLPISEIQTICECADHVCLTKEAILRSLGDLSSGNSNAADGNGHSTGGDRHSTVCDGHSTGNGHSTECDGLSTGDDKTQ